MASEKLLSLPFSGCYFAKVRYLDETFRVYHIHTDQNAGYSCKTIWNQFMNERIDIKEVTIFNPIENVDQGHAEIWGIISNDNKCFSVVVDPELEGNEQTGCIEYKKAIFKKIIKQKCCSESI